MRSFIKEKIRQFQKIQDGKATTNKQVEDLCILIGLQGYKLKAERIEEEDMADDNYGVDQDVCVDTNLVREICEKSREITVFLEDIIDQAEVPDLLLSGD